MLSEEKKQQVIALGKLGWPLRRIEQATGVRRETASAYLKSAGVVVCLPGWGRRTPAKPATVTPDFIAPFSEKQGAPSAPSPASASVCEAYRELIEQGLARGRNGKAIWQDLVSDHGFAGGYQAVKRFVRTLAQPYVDLACAQVSKRPVVHPHTSDCYTIVVPRRTVDVEALMRKAVEAIERDAKQPHRSDGRHEITTEG